MKRSVRLLVSLVKARAPGFSVRSSRSAAAVEGGYDGDSLRPTGDAGYQVGPHPVGVHNVYFLFPDKAPYGSHGTEVKLMAHYHLVGGNAFPAALRGKRPPAQAEELGGKPLPVHKAHKGKQVPLGSADFTATDYL